MAEARSLSDVPVSLDGQELLEFLTDLTTPSTPDETSQLVDGTLLDTPDKARAYLRLHQQRILDEARGFGL